MKHSYFVGIDVGTSSTKTGLWRDDGCAVAETVADYPVYRPRPSWAEMDALDWWRATCQTVQQAIAQSGIGPEEIAGVGVDGLSGAPVPVDVTGEPLCRVPIWQDRRSQEEADRLKILPEASYLINLNPNPLDPAHSTSKVLWLANRQPELFEAVYRFLPSSGFIVQKLTGEFTCDHTQAFDYHFFDARQARWDQKAADVIGVPLDKFPPLYQSCDIVGTITGPAAAATGLSEGTPVIAGGLDACVGSLGVGVARLGQTVDQGGQAGGMALVLDHVIVEPRLMFTHHVVPGRFLLHSGTVGGGSLRWFLDTLGQSELRAAELVQSSPFSLLSQQVEETPPGAHGLIFLPYMAGERSPLWNSDARGVFFGLSYKTTRGDVVRSIMEGCALAVQHNVRVAAEHNVFVREWIGVGGATRSNVWCQIKADVTNRPFVVARRADGGEGGHTLGLTAMIRKALGLCDDLAEQMDAYLPHRRVCEPSAERHAMYQDLLDIYMKLSTKLQPDFADLAAAVAAYPEFLGDS